MKKKLLILLALLIMLTSAQIMASAEIDGMSDGWYWPLASTSSQRISSGFGVKRSSGYHQGIDISFSGIGGKAVYAARDGVVYKTGSDSSMGNYVCISHGKNATGQYVFTTYMHMRDNSVCVKKGDSVTPDTKLGLVGTTGHSTGDHLHFQIFRSSSSSPSSVSPIHKYQADLNSNYYNPTPGAVVTYNYSLRDGKSVKLKYNESAKRSINEGSLADGTWSYEKPSYESKTVKYWKNGDIIDTIAIYEDAEQRLWCELADHTFIEKDIEFDDCVWERCAFVESTATYWATGIKYANSVEGTPSGKLTKGDNFGLRGTVYSTDSITDVIGYIYRADGSIEMQSNPMNLTGTATSVDIRYSNVNNNLSFGKLANGVYRYVVKVYTRHGEGIKVVESVFGIGVEPDITLTGLTFENEYKTISLNAATAETFTLVPKYSPSNTAETGVIWSSSDPSVATVSESGVVKAVAPGSATITAVSKAHSEISVSCEVSVYSRITSFTLDRERVDISTADGVNSFDLTANVQPAGTACNFEWRTSNSAVATVSDTNGNVCTVLLTGNTGGAVITAKALDGSGLEKTCVINVADPSASSLKITNFAYPSTYKIDTTNGFSWSYSGSGTFSSDHDLDQLTINIYYGSSGTKLSYSRTFDPGTKSISMNTKDSTGHTLGSYIKMSKVNVTGHARIEVIISDTSGAYLSRSKVIKVVNTGSTVTSSFSAVYSAPTLITETEKNGHKYQLYKSSYTWNQAKDYALTKGGHLATVCDAEENAILKNLVQGIAGSGAWLGCYHDSNGWNWVTGEQIEYKNWASGQPDLAMGIEDKVLIQTGDGTWNDAMNNILDYFIVEYESPIESIAFTQQFVNLTRDRDFYGYPTNIQFNLREGVDPETVEYPKIIYASQDTSVATVDQNGVITPMCDAGSTVIMAYPENDSSKTAYLPVGCFTVYGTQLGVEDEYTTVLTYDTDAVIVNYGASIGPLFNYYYEGYIFGDIYHRRWSVSEGLFNDVSEVEGMEGRVMSKRDFGLFEAIGYGYDIICYMAYDENGDMVTIDSFDVYVPGGDEEIRLPSGAKTVEAEAFENTGARYLVVPAGVESIESGAFAGTDLDVVVFKGGNTDVSDGAFSGYPTFMFLRSGGKTENALREHGMYCLDAVYVEGLN